MEGLVAALGVLAVLHVLYATWTARRLDRLHARVDTATAALDQQLRQRAETALGFARAGRGPAQRALAEAAGAALGVQGLGHDREVVENALSRALRGVAAEAPEVLVDVTTRTSFARRFRNDAVRDALVVRRRRIVRWFHLYGHAPLPTYFEIDDSVLERRTIEV